MTLSHRIIYLFQPYLTSKETKNPFELLSLVSDTLISLDIALDSKIDSKLEDYYDLESIVEFLEKNSTALSSYDMCTVFYSIVHREYFVYNATMADYMDYLHEVIKLPKDAALAQLYYLTFLANEGMCVDIRYLQSLFSVNITNVGFEFLSDLLNEYPLKHKPNYLNNFMKL